LRPVSNIPVVHHLKPSGRASELPNGAAVLRPSVLDLKYGSWAGAVHQVFNEAEEWPGPITQPKQLPTRQLVASVSVQKPCMARTSGTHSLNICRGQRIIIV
jgi:hypothetical protein